MLGEKTRGSAQHFWIDMTSFARGVEQALALEAAGKPAEAAAKYDDIIEAQRNALPGDAPQWTLLMQRAAELRKP